MSTSAAKPKSPFGLKLVNDFQLLLHFFVIIGGLILSWFINPLIVLAVGILHKLHIKVLKGCLLTNINKLTGGIESDKGFWQTVFKRFFDKDISKTTARSIDYGWTISMLIISIIGYLSRY
jgi:hypothetical protein